MNLIRSLIMSLLFMPGIAVTETTHSPDATIIFSDVRVFDGEKMLGKRTVVVEDGTIVSVSAQNPSAATVEKAEMIKGEGLTLMPGLIDSHVHTFSRTMLVRALDFGVTTVFDMWSTTAGLTFLKAMQGEGDASDRADIRAACIGVTAPGSHGTQFGDIPTLSSPENAAGFVEERVRECSDYIKIIYDNFKMFDREVPTLSRETMEAVVTAAHANDRMVVSHSRDLQAYEEVALAGGDGFVHAPVDAIPSRELAELLKERGMFVIPTMVMSTVNSKEFASDSKIAPQLTEKEIENLSITRRMQSDDGEMNARGATRLFHENGIPILAGSDAPNRGTAYGVSLHHELAELVNAGLSPEESLRAATSVSARVFGMEDRGLIAAGKKADLLLLRGDPTADVTATRDIEGVWKAGQRHR